MSFGRASPGLWGAATHTRAPGALTPRLPPQLPATTAMRNIFKRNQEPIVAPATTTMPAGPADNSTASGGAREGPEDVFTKMRDRFFNEMNKIPREWPRVRWGWYHGGRAVTVFGCVRAPHQEQRPVRAGMNEGTGGFTCHS